MAAETEDNPLEQLVELLVYAPIGLLYEYPEVLPQLIKKGKSQVQLAKFAGQLALNRQQAKSTSPDNKAGITGSPEMIVETIANLITEVGAMIGLAPASDAPAPTQTKPDAASDAQPATTTAKGSTPTATSSPAATQTTKLPIDDYQSLNAREVVSLLDDLTKPQLERVQVYEVEHRNRKTVLTKIDRLLA